MTSICQLQLADALRLAGRRADAEHALDMLAASMPAEPNYEAAAASIRAQNAIDGGDSRHVRGMLESAVRRAREGGASASLLSCLLTKLGACLRLQNCHEEALTCHNEAVAVAAEVGDLRRQANGLGNLSILEGFGRPAMARKHLAEAARIFAELQCVHSSAVVALQQGELDAVAGDFASAREHYLRALHNYQLTGNPRGVAIAHTNLADTLYALGDSVLAEEHMQAAVEVAQATQSLVVEASGHGLLGRLALERGDWNRAQELLELALVGLERRAGAAYVAMLELNLAVLDALDGAHASAKARMTKATAALHRGRARQTLAVLPAAQSAITAATALCCLGKGDAAQLAANQSMAIGAVRPEVVGTDCEVFLRLGVTLLAKANGPGVADTTELTVGRRGHWFRVAGETVDIHRRKTLRRTLMLLVNQQGAILSTEVLFAHVWPGQRVAIAVQSQRVRNAIAQLRKLGLRAIESCPSGYRLNANLRVARWPARLMFL